MFQISPKRIKDINLFIILDTPIPLTAPLSPRKQKVHKHTDNEG